CRANGVKILFSPPATPSYNGACEAGVGSIKTRTHHEAARRGRAQLWTCDDSKPRAVRPTPRRAPGESTGPLQTKSGNKELPSPPKSGVCSWQAARRMLDANATREGSTVAHLSTTTSKPPSTASPASVLWSSTAICNSGGGD